MVHHHHDKHAKHVHANEGSYWASWCSPVGLGIFAATAAIAFAVIVYTLISIAGIVISLSARNAQNEALQNSQYGAPSQSGAYPIESSAPAGR
jgi:uncharacterized phage infection (PIP) family protein YhgE